MDTTHHLQYESMTMRANIGGVDVTFVVEFPEPILDPAKLPKVTLTTSASVRLEAHGRG